ncbi:MAG: TDP-N-acetylfucosamine:lipid II N-acetylfucosaminyltransferase [Cyclobacteriaceae bacterium]|nr:TDP-N-acetylfucosamine:lipid II N-acetylfucosaminyltransferase [Cyclobacteriaceae bacterium]
MKKKFRILHICQDEKFIDGAIYLFEKAFPASNTFLVLLPTSNPPIKYITNTSIPLKKIANSKNSLEGIKEFEKEFDFVILHGLNHITASLVNSSASKERYLWISLGAEVYQNKLLYPFSILGVKTASLKLKIKNSIEIKDIIKTVYRKLRYRHVPMVGNGSALVASAVKQIVHFGSLIKEEFDYLHTNKLIDSKAVLQTLAYYPIEYFAKNGDASLPIGSNILIGNSASYTNNHLEIFDFLKEIDIGNRQIIVPLSYGNTKYQKEIVKEGTAQFGVQFVAMLKFMPLSEYNKVIQSCGIIIMNHYRQQGVGNILQSLWAGRKVFLSEKNILFAYFNRIGCVVFSIEKELNSNSATVLDLLTRQEWEQNKKVLKNEISEDILVENLRKGLSKMLFN